MQARFPLKPYSAPIFEALQKVQFWVERDAALRLLVAAPSRKELKRQHWPEHVRVTPAKTLGRRVTARGSRRILVAFWPDDHYQAARQPSLLCVIRGQAVLDVADYKLCCHVGDFVLIPQGVPYSALPHLAEDQTDAQCDILWLRGNEERTRLDCWICHSAPGVHESGPQYGACWVENSSLATQFSNLCEEAQDACAPDITYHFLAGILHMLHREIDRGRAFLPRHHRPENNPEALSKHAHDPVQQACIYVNEHLDQPLTAARMARYVCLSTTLFHTKFHRETGQTFLQYLTAQRLLKAAALLRESDVPVNVVAKMIGLHYSQLRRLFLQHYGCVPGEFRKRK